MAVSQLNDLKVQALRQLGYLDKQLNVNECLFWKTFSNKTEYNDLKKAWLAAIGFNKSTLVDSYYAYLRSQGYTGSIPDMEWKALISNTLYFSPLSLFQAGEQGAWYDPSDLSSLFQDSAGTIPVTAVEQPVGMMRDKSGWGNHVIQATATSRPILRQDGNGKYYLACDGVDDGMATAGSVNFTGTNKVTVCVGLRRQVGLAGGTVLELSATSTGNNGTFLVNTDDGLNTGRTLFRSRGLNPVDVTPSVMSNSVVITGMGDIGANVATCRANGVVSTSNADQGGGNYGSYPLFLFRRGGTNGPFNGNFHGAVIRGAASSASQISQLEAYMNAKTGAF